MNAPTTNLFDVPVVYHIGYQGRNIAEFLEVLKQNHIDVLVDLREKPCSRMKGFSKNQLATSLGQMGIKYEWAGKRLGGFTLGPREWRAALPQIGRMTRSATIALMCMERNPNQCHRQQLVRMLEDEHGVVGMAL